MNKTSSPEDHLTGTQGDWEEAIFRSADHFSVFRRVPGTGGETFKCKTFPEAVSAAKAQASDTPVIIYAITLSGRSCVIPKTDWQNYLRIWADLQEPA